MLNKILADYWTTGLMLSSIIIGSLVGVYSSTIPNFLGSILDPTILIMIFLIFLAVPYEKLANITSKFKFISIVWITNFIIIPIIGYTIAKLLIGNNSALFIGLLIYFMAPCTDWFLAFTKLGKGDTTTGSVLIPIQMISQLLLYPVYLTIFANTQTNIPFGSLMSTLLNWFAIPFILGLATHFILKKLLKSKTVDSIFDINDKVIEGILALIVLIVFATNIETILENTLEFLLVLLGTIIFFTIIFFLTRESSNWFRFSLSERTLYTISSTARNSPLMLAVTLVAIPDQPLIYAAIIIGSLIEFPQLTFLSTHFAKKSKKLRKKL